MKRRNARILRRGAISLLVVALGYLVIAPMEGEDRHAFDEDGRYLRERVERYVELRYADDWESLYEMTDPKDRERVSRGNFLAQTQLGVMKVLDMQIGESRLVENRATVKIHMTAQLVPENLPASFRTVRYDDDSDLSQQQAFDLEWVWRKGVWYFRMPSELTRGVNYRGQKVDRVYRNENDTGGARQ